MTNTIKCKKCGTEIEISEALKHQIEEQVFSAVKEKHKLEVEEARKSAEEAALKKAHDNFEISQKQLKKEAEEEKEQRKKVQEELLTMTSELRKVTREKEDAKFEMEKKLLAEEEKIRQEVKKKADEEHQLKDAEKDKKLQDALKMNDELKRKLEQGSVQSQGEVMEVELEKTLRKDFPEDIIKEVKKGERGADIIQTVVDKLRRKCGIILWESKNAQWSDGWIKKLKEDQRAVGAFHGVLVAANPPDRLETYTYHPNGVWITTRKMARALALALRFELVHVQFEKLAGVNKKEKMEELYQYVRSVEFVHRIEAVVEAFNNLLGDIEKEKRWFNTKWARQEKELRKIIDNTQGMYGEFQAVTGRELQEIKLLSSIDDTKEEIIIDQ